MRNGAIMRAMAAILIQSIGMTPGGISPQILIRFNALIHLRTVVIPQPELIWKTARRV